MLLLPDCGGDRSSGSSGSGAPAATASPSGAAPAGTAAPTGKEVTVDLSSAGQKYKGMSIRGPGFPKLLSKPGDATVQWSRPPSDRTAPEFMVTIGTDKLDVADMKKWVTDWAKGFDPPGKITYITDKPGELEYSVERKGEDGKPVMAYGYGVEVKLGADTFSCSAPNLEGPDLPILKSVCQSLTKK
jgi:hypothetical protein